MIAQLEQGDNLRKIIKNMILCLRDRHNFGTNPYLDVNQSGYNILLTTNQIFIASLEQPYFLQKDIPIFMPVLTFIGDVYVPFFQKLKPYEELY